MATVILKVQYQSNPVPEKVYIGALPFEKVRCGYMGEKVIVYQMQQSATLHLWFEKDIRFLCFVLD